jgi:hypothetical protein
MFLPLVALAFLVGPGPAVLTACTVPLLSGVLTGMPPFWPPVGPFMAVELAATCGVIALARRWRPRWIEWMVLVPALLIGRVTYLGLVYVFAQWVDLPAGFLAGISFLVGWPGMVLMLVVVPPVVRRIGSRQATSERRE